MSTSSPQATLLSEPRHENTRILHIQVPEGVFNRAKAKSLLCGKSWPVFVVELLNKAGASLATSPNSE